MALAEMKEPPMMTQLDATVLIASENPAETCAINNQQKEGNDGRSVDPSVNITVSSAPTFTCNTPAAFTRTTRRVARAVRHLWGRDAAAMQYLSDYNEKRLDKKEEQQ